MPTTRSLAITRHQVGAGAQVLSFDAAASVVLSDGTTCAVEAPESLVRAKGYKHAVPPPGDNLLTYGVWSRLDGSNGFVEK